MRTVRFARLRFERKLSHYTDQRSAIERRKAALLEVIDYHTDVNALLRKSDDAGANKMINRGDWSYGDVIEDKNIIAARLAKVKKERERTPDDEVEGFPPTEREGTDASFFVIDLSESVMAYEYRGNVGPKAPYRILELSFNEYHEGEEEIVISPLVDKVQVREEIGNLQRISRVKFSNLTPTNPDSTDRSEPMDSFLREGRIDRLMLEGWNTDDEESVGDEGIRVEQVPLLDGGLSLAEEGYGSALVEGEDKDGNEKEVSTDDRPIETEADIAEENDRDKKGTLREQIRIALDRLE